MANTLKSFVALIALASCSSAFSQATSYHHRSTPEGDITAARAELFRALGAADRDHAEAYRAYVSGDEQQLLLDYRLYQIRQEVAADKQEATQRKADNRRQRRADEALTRDEAARQLVVELQLGLRPWPEALRRPEYRQSLCVIESILQRWSRSGPGQDLWARRALATEAGVLRRRVETNDSIRFLSRERAVEALSLVSRLATLDLKELAPATSYAAAQ